ncbi:MAG: hypothetical protein ACRCZF_14600 [Gemmataceae bacterium]
MTPTMTPPDWLTKRDGSLKLGIRPEIVFVMLGGQPLYRLDVRPASGKFICNVTQTVNGQRLDGPEIYANSADAFTGGLATLRSKLGW